MTTDETMSPFKLPMTKIENKFKYKMTKLLVSILKLNIVKLSLINSYDLSVIDQYLQYSLSVIDFYH